MTQQGNLVVSIDVEDWPQSTWNRSLPVTTRAEMNTHRLLDRLASDRVTATMFVLGKFAETFPATVKRMVREGHEVASHGYGHVEIFTQDYATFREDVRRSKGFLEDITGVAVSGFRAPDFSIVRRSLWALEVLAEEGFSYDSSIFPIVHSRYGISGWPAHPVSVSLPSGRTITELPLATLALGHRLLPVAGGGYHRLLPYWMIKAAITSVTATGAPFVTYCHPYEFDPQEFSETDLALPLKVRLHQGLGRRGFSAKFHRMLADFPVTHAGTTARGSAWPVHTLDADTLRA
jgi:polysaccharide deacetylase family protein (PEP-CTERM system associated)